MLCPCNSVCDKCTKKLNYKKKRGEKMVYVYHNKCDQKEHKKKVSSAKAPKNNVCDKHMEFAFKSCPTCLRQYERQMKGFINFFYREVANAEDLKGLQRAYDEYEQEKKVC